jgi:hypothetical protein
MSESPKPFWAIPVAQEGKRPWAIVLAGGRAIRLRQGKRYAVRPGGRAVAGGDYRKDLLERHRDSQWH